MKIGDTARLVQPEIKGEVIDTRFNKDASELEHLLSYTGQDGNTHERWFLQTDLEVAKK